jgi:SH3-like domain-containing protein
MDSFNTKRPLAARRHAGAGLFAFSLALLTPILLASSTVAGEQMTTGTASGLPLPRFVSLKSDRVNVRAGPTKDHQVAFVFTRPALPVEIVAEFETWRRIRDWEGSEGWVYHSLLSGRRTAIVSRSAKDDLVTLHQTPTVASEVVARLEPGVVGMVKTCKDGWCRITGESFDGWAVQDRLWGVYPGEAVD